MEPRGTVTGGEATVPGNAFTNLVYLVIIRLVLYLEIYIEQEKSMSKIEIYNVLGYF